MKNKILEKNYILQEDLNGNDVAMCEACLTHDTSISLSEVFSEIADDYIEIYNANLFDIGFVLYANGHTEEAVSSGIYDRNTGDIIQHLQSAHYLYNKAVLFENIEIIAYNFLVQFVNSNKLPISEELLEAVNIDSDDSLDSIKNSLIELFMESVEAEFYELLNNNETSLDKYRDCLYNLEDEYASRKEDDEEYEDTNLLIRINSLNDEIAKKENFPDFVDLNIDIHDFIDKYIVDVLTEKVEEYLSGVY